MVNLLTGRGVLRPARDITIRGLLFPTDNSGRFSAKTDPDKCQVLVFNCQETKTFSLYAYIRYKCERLKELCESLRALTVYLTKNETKGT